MKRRYRIAYCYPTSPRADELGAPGYYIEESILREDGTWSPPYVATGCGDVFPSSDDSELMAQLAECRGEVRPAWACFARIAEGTGRSCWRLVSTHKNAHAAAAEARRLWEASGVEHCASGND